MKNKKYKHSQHKIILSSSDQKLLLRYCALNKIGQTTAIKRILRTYLQDNLPEIDPEAENQLGLFDPVQMNIFDI
ncbi:MAG: hypothetical protein PHN41_07425 [Bacteroidales bacterium]|jgi:hypothetical protein|nr:hypothetical protein [Bacteroidales bacterium]MDD4703405.1 hypothetical protein [Bacteroidales bacterium]MDX9798015.1 hypothetical protein [Bacteroidales bacterium]